MDLRQVHYQFRKDEEDFDVEARVDGIVIARAMSIRKSNFLDIADICVRDDISPSWPIFDRLVQSMFGPRRPLNLRGKGIGSELLVRLLQEADKEGIEEITGSVMPDAIRDQPFLLKWYERHGFNVMEPDGESVRGAAKRIVRHRS